MPPTYRAIITTLGAAKLAAAAGTASPMSFGFVAVGDGGGLPTTPSAAQTTLVRETARVVVNLVDIDPANPNTVRVEGLIPAATGGFTIREAAIFDSDGDMIAVANYPDIYKPNLADGLSVEEYIRILLVYTNPTSAIALTVDTSVIMASREYVDDALRFSRVVVEDDFTGGSIDDSTWVETVTSDGAISTDVSPIPSLGVAKIDPGNSGSAKLETKSFDFTFAPKFFDFRCRFAVSQIAINGLTFIGLTGTGIDIGFVMDYATSPVVAYLRIDGVLLHWPYDYRYDWPSSYINVRIKHDESGFWFYINDVEIWHDVVYSPAMNGVKVSMSTTHGTRLFADRVSLKVPEWTA